MAQRQAKRNVCVCTARLGVLPAPHEAVPHVVAVAEGVSREGARAVEVAAVSAAVWGLGERPGETSRQATTWTVMRSI